MKTGHKMMTQSLAYSSTYLRLLQYHTHYTHLHLANHHKVNRSHQTSMHFR